MSLIERAINKLRTNRIPATSPTIEFPLLPSDGQVERPVVRPEVVPPDPVASIVRPDPVTIPLSRLSRQGFIVPGGEPVRTLNEFRMIKRPLVYNISDRKVPPLPNARRIMVTSALPKEGKTFCAINLALSIADERDHSVLLVDADVARPSIPDTLGVSAASGLMDALIDPAVDVAALVAPTSIDNLSLLTAGTHHAKATELLASAAMSRLLQRLSSAFPDHIMIFDSPPLLATTESSVLAAYMGQIILVVEAGNTQRVAVASALASLEAVPGVVSTLMNKHPSGSKKELLPYGGYGYEPPTRA